MEKEFLAGMAKVFVVNGSPTGLDAEAAFCGKDLAVFAEAILRSFPSEGAVS